MENLTLAAKPVSCNKKCSVCCIETVEEIRLRAESLLQQRSLTLSSVLVVLMFIAHTVFAYQNRAFPIPDFVWVVIASPWCGAGIGKIVMLLAGKGKNGK